jgi:hypothetical protein
VVWSDYAREAEVGVAKGIRLDTTYYYWPGSWVLDRPGLFTGSGMPMRYAKADGTMLDVYQAATQLSDESSLTYSTHIATLLDNALGAPGFYGTFVANMHTDEPSSPGSNAIIAAAVARGVPVISAKQLLTWLDGRNNSSFSAVSWAAGLPNAPQGGSNLNFTVTAGAGANGLQAMLPYRLRNGIGRLTSLHRNGVPVPTELKTLKGIEYAVFSAVAGSYVAQYDTTAPDTTFTATAPASTNLGTASFSFASNEPGDTLECSLDGAAFAACTSPQAFSGLTTGSHTFRVRATDVSGNVETTPATHTWTIDLVAPTVSTRTPAPGATGFGLTAAVGVGFSEPISPSSITSSSFRIRRVGGSSDLPATVSVSGSTATLQPGAPLVLGWQYQVTVAGSVTDLAGNPMGADVVWTFTADDRITDSLASEFAAGTVDSTGRVTNSAGGEVMLGPGEGSDFTSALPAGWTSTPWPSGGSSTISSGVLTVNGARVNPTALFTPGRTLEFVATFSSDGYQHAGFGVALDNMPWAIFSTGAGGVLMARTHNGSAELNTMLSASLLNTPHTFRIDWTSTSVVYRVDGAQVASHPIAIASQMRPVASDYLASGGSLRLDSMWMSPPYAPSSTFISRVIDAGANASWTRSSWTVDLPAGTSIVVSVRTGNTVTPDGSWSAFTTVPSSGGTFSLGGRYAQYRIQLVASPGGDSPVVRDVTLHTTVQ